MRRPETLKYLFDIAEACSLLDQFVSGKVLADYEADALLRSAVERQFEIIGEALRLAIRDDPALAGQVTHSGRIIAFRNRLIHGYAAVLNDVVWGILETDLPTLRREVATLLAGEGETP
jgi:uncharacterized protein with HEPN domain